MKYVIAFILSLTAGSVVAACPINQLIISDLNQIYSDLKFAKSPQDARNFTDQLWILWTKAPNDEAQQLLDGGMLKMRQGDLNAAEATLTELVIYCPDYAEGYNQRAFARYLSSNFKDALPDLEKALSILPRHLGALSGAGLTYLALGQASKAEIQFRKALALNPFTPERDLIRNLGTDL